MPILMPQDTRTVLGENALQCQSRSLFFDRFADPSAKEQERQAWFSTLLKKALEKRICQSRTAWMESLPNHNVLYAQLLSRLMVNMAGGAMENAGLCLDRFGIPYIPGSAVKGCARRMALFALHEWCEGGGKPDDADNPCAKACVEYDTPAAMLTAIALVFGWGQIDWKDQKKNGRYLSDFAWACGSEKWDTISVNAKEMLCNAMNGKSLPNDFAGSIAFLPAYPIKTEAKDLPLPEPDLGKLELDIVTCHHTEYYKGTLDTATDTEDPIPVIFPAVAAGHVFKFDILPLRYCMPFRIVQTQNWLAAGLSTFGLGAKTNAGYGWFDISNDLQQKVQNGWERMERLHHEEQKCLDEEKHRKEEEAERQRKAELFKAMTANMTPEAKADYELAQLSDDQFRSRIDNFLKREPSEQQAIVRAIRLASDRPDSRAKFWEDLKTKAKKGGKSAQIEQSIRKISKNILPGKEGKMP